MDRYDEIIRQCLKQWVMRHSPPADGRARLLRAAASAMQQPRLFVSPRGGRMRPCHSLEIPTELFSWALIYTIERGIATQNLVS